jgi:hypothetical protein
MREVSPFTGDFHLGGERLPGLCVRYHDIGVDRIERLTDAGEQVSAL